MRSMKRFRVLFIGAVLTAAAIAITVAMPGSAAPPTANSIDNPIKINVMGEWAHPDDDTSIIGPCGVWHQRYGVRCGIIMITRGEGGGNAVGTGDRPGARPAPRERGPRRALPLGHGRHLQPRHASTSSTTRARPLTQFFWGHDETLRPRHADHPHDPAGRLHRLHADARRRPRQPPAGRPHDLGGHATPRPTRRCSPSSSPGPHALSTWQVKKVFSGGSTAGTRRHDDRRRLHHRLHPDARHEPRHRRRRRGRATTRRTSGRPATSRASRPARRRSGRRSPSEGALRLPDAEPHDEQGHGGRRAARASA